MQLKTFQLGLRTLTGALPYGKKLNDEEISFLFMTLPQKVRDEVPDDAWVYGISKALAETDPDKEMPIHMRVLNHVYKSRNGHPCFDWGIKDHVKEQFNLSSNHGTPKRLQADAEGWNSQGLLDAGDPRSTFFELGF